MSLGPTVLVVEDDEQLRHYYRTALMMSGFHVREARSGFEALRMIDSSPVDLVVLDLMLPGVDGFMVREELAAQAGTRAIPIVIVTGAGGDLDYLHVPCLLRKPVSPDQLVQAVRHCLARGQPVVRSAAEQGQPPGPSLRSATPSKSGKRA